MKKLHYIESSFSCVLSFSLCLSFHEMFPTRTGIKVQVVLDEETAVQSPPTSTLHALRAVSALNFCRRGSLLFSARRCRLSQPPPLVARHLNLPISSDFPKYTRAAEITHIKGNLTNHRRGIIDRLLGFLRFFQVHLTRPKYPNFTDNDYRYTIQSQRLCDRYRRERGRSRPAFAGS